VREASSRRLVTTRAGSNVERTVLLAMTQRYRERP
jgi:hypothetical protein